jgi:hypothetical protein
MEIALSGYEISTVIRAASRPFGFSAELSQWTGPGRGCIDELPDGIRGPAPNRHAVFIASRRVLVGARCAFLERPIDRSA